MARRAYQSDAHCAIMRELARVDSTLLHMATGTGKTHVFAGVASQWPGRTIIVEPQRQLVTQTYEKLASMGESCGIEMGDERVMRSDLPRIVVTTMQTFCKEDRQAVFDPAVYTLLIIDEAHHACSGSALGIIKAYAYTGDNKLLGATATPKRADRKALGDVFETVAYSYPIETAIKDGYLVPIKQRPVLVDKLDFSSVRETVGDLNVDDLDKLLTQETIIHKMVAPTVELCGDESTLFYCCSVNHAIKVAEVINRYKPQSAHAVHGGVEDRERRHWIAAFRERRLQYLCLCDIGVEGFDAPVASRIVMGRPTTSAARYEQIAGRGTRVLPGVVDMVDTPEERRAAIASSRKPCMVIYDYVGNSGRHKLMNALDVLGGLSSPAVREYALRNVVDDGKEVDIGDAILRAEVELALEEEERKFREIRKRVRAEAEYRLDDVSPFDAAAVPEPAAQTNVASEPVTKKQVWKLMQLGFHKNFALTRTKRQAGAIIAAAVRRASRGG